MPEGHNIQCVDDVHEFVVVARFAPKSRLISVRSMARKQHIVPLRCDAIVFIVSTFVRRSTTLIRRLGKQAISTAVCHTNTRTTGLGMANRRLVKIIPSLAALLLSSDHAATRLHSSPEWPSRPDARVAVCRRPLHGSPGRRPPSWRCIMPAQHSAA